MREWTLSNTVVVSEYEAPDDFVCVREFVSQMGLSVGNKETRPKRVERVFMHKDQAYLANMQEKLDNVEEVVENVETNLTKGETDGIQD